MMLKMDYLLNTIISSKRNYFSFKLLIVVIFSGMFSEAIVSEKRFMLPIGIATTDDLLTYTIKNKRNY